MPPVELEAAGATVTKIVVVDDTATSPVALIAGVTVTNTVVVLEAEVTSLDTVLGDAVTVTVAVTVTASQIPR